MINILVPMAGRGKRFADAGYDRPKPFIDVDGLPMIERVMENLDPREECVLTYLCLSDFVKRYNDEFRAIMDEYVSFAQLDYRIVEVDKVTEGAACTALLAEEFINNDEELVIANCDQLVLDSQWNNDAPDYMAASLDFYRKREADGGILCFLNDSPKWSYARMAGDRIVEVVEKQVVSNIATVGIYYYRKGSFFVDAAKSMIGRNFRVNNEFYVAPAYNDMICRGQKVIPYMVNDMVGLGTPEDLKAYLTRIADEHPQSE